MALGWDGVLNQARSGQTWVGFLGIGANATNLGGWPYKPIRARTLAMGCPLFSSSDLLNFPLVRGNPHERVPAGGV